MRFSLHTLPLLPNRDQLRRFGVWRVTGIRGRWLIAGARWALAKPKCSMPRAVLLRMSGLRRGMGCANLLAPGSNYKILRERFRGFRLKLRQLSRLSSAKEAKHRAMHTVGRWMWCWHMRCCAESVRSKSPVTVIDEEQHFGVSHKRGAKAQCGTDIHVDLTATPIRRTSV